MDAEEKEGIELWHRSIDQINLFLPKVLWSIKSFMEEDSATAVAYSSGLE